MNLLPVPLHNQRPVANDPHFVAAPLTIPTGDFELAWLEMGNRYIVFEPTTP